jgi:ketopantoate reductase
MNLAIIGAGNLGTALGERLQRAGHAIMFGGGASAKDAAARHGAEVGRNSAPSSSATWSSSPSRSPRPSQPWPTPARSARGFCGHASTP